MNTKRFTSIGISLLFTLAASVLAQPEKRLDSTGVVNAACALVSNPADTLNLPTDDSGFTQIFDGKSLKGFWESCQSSHSNSDKTYGGFWLVDSAKGYLFANNNAAGNAGSILMTNKKYGNYELIFDLWPSFGDDGGVFNRTTAAGSCYQTTIDYIGGSSVGGVYFEGGYDNSASRNYDPYVFGSNRYTVTNGTGATNNLTYMTKTFSNPTDYGCPATGCTPANWTAIWDTGGWNQMRVKFFGGTVATATNLVHNQAWIRKFGSPYWIPTISDSVQFSTPASYLGFQIHGGGNWTNKNGHFYRNIKLRPLTDQGVPIILPTSLSGKTGSHYNLRATSGALVGMLDSDREITISDLSGRVLEKFSVRSGVVHHAFTTQSRGVLLVAVKTSRHTDYLRVTRLFD